MFGLSTKEMLYKIIVNACYNCKNTYKNAVIQNLDEISNAFEMGSEELLMAIRREYLDDVANSVINTFRAGSPKTFMNIQSLLISPHKCGYDLDIDNGIMAGGVFAICYYAMKNKTAPPKLCVQLNHIQNDIMDEVLQEIDSE